MTERRFNEAEVAAILERATRAEPAGQRQLPSGEGGDGMTLAELQDIGREVGIAPDLIRDAALSVGQSGVVTSRRFFGLPLGVGRTVELDRRLTDEEWERFVVDLRETFDARGVVRSEGSLRQWTNGNLQALLEPTESGHRVRLKTVKSDARGLMMLGLTFMGVSAATMIGAVVAGIGGQAGIASEIGIMAAIGAAAFAFGAGRLPGWARLRRQQMEDLAARLASMASKEPASDDPGPRR